MTTTHHPRCAIFDEPPGLQSDQDCNCGAISPLPTTPKVETSIMVSSRLLCAVADLIESSEPTVVDGIAAERPCFISQSSPGYFRVQVGIFASQAWLYDKDGKRLAELS